MSLLTLEVQIVDGQVVPTHPAQLPVTGKGLLTILPEEPADHDDRLAQMDAFLDEFSGIIDMPSEEEMAKDPRLEYLIKKHVK